MKFTTFAIAMTSLVSSTSALLPILNKEMTNLFDAWKTEFAHTFDSLVEEEKRLLVFIKNAQMIIKHNKKFAAGEVSYDLSLNRYAHLTWAEFKENMMQFKMPANHISHAEYTHEAPNMRNLASSSVDWRDEGAVTPVKNQGQCGSCWSFSTTGAIEGAHFIKTGELIPLSEQQLLNCVHDGQCTCSEGGEMSWAFEYVKNVGGIVRESDMPYKNIKGGEFDKCAYEERYYSGDKSEFAASIKGYADVKKNNEAALASALSQQPVSIAIDASDPTFQFYSSGIFDPDSCCEYWECVDEDLDHGVLAVGYGSDSFGEYWIVKNSWGPKWGDNGFIKMVKGKGSKCGVATSASYPIV